MAQWYEAVHASKRFRLGTRKRDIKGHEYIYVKGVSSGAAGKWVSYDEAYATTLLAANAVGAVGILMAAVDASTKFGWAQIYGVNTIASTDTVAADAALFIDGTAGRADDAGVAGDWIQGAWSMTADTSNVATLPSGIQQRLPNIIS
jgi:hypothetical protein